MPNPIGPDGIAVSGLGWTTQSTQFNSNKNLESYGNPTSFLINPPSWNNYLGWSMITEDAIATATHPATNTNLLTRIFVPVGGTSTACDFFPLVANGITSFNVGLYTTAGVQIAIGTPQTVFTGWAAAPAGSTQTITWTSSVALTNDTFYYVACVAAWATTAPTFSGCQASTAAALNAGLTVSTAEAASNGTAATLPASYTMSSNVFTQFEYFLAVR